jgi:S-adenosylmethionine-dependent methyltransferase
VGVSVAGVNGGAGTETWFGAGVAGRSGRRPDRVRELVFGALETVRGPAGEVNVLDCGGGSGRLAVPLAVAGAQVTVLDISVDALAVLRRRAAEAGVADRIVPVQADVEALAEPMTAGRFDLAIVHEVLEVVERPAVVLAAVARAVRLDGLVSILAVNPAAGVISRALAGELAAALAELRAIVAEPEAPGRLAPDALLEMCRAAGLAVETTSGVGVFSELAPGSRVEAPGGYEALAALESLAASLSPYRDIAARVHVLARRGRDDSAELTATDR